MPNGQVTCELVMEFISGGTLDDLLEKGLIKADRNLVDDIAFDILSALDEINARGFMYMDLKPNNVLVVHQHDGTYKYKLADFGHCVALGVVCLVGTPLYQAPELQARGKKRLDRAAIWSLFAILAQSSGLIDLRAMTAEKRTSQDECRFFFFFTI